MDCDRHLHNVGRLEEDAVGIEDDFVRVSRAMFVLTEPVLGDALRTFPVAPGSRGLDAGCGIGLHLPMLAQAVGSAGHVTGIDCSPPYLAVARAAAARAGLAHQVSFHDGDVYCLPYVDDAFDWAWSVDCVGYMPDAAPLRELARVVRPGGTVAILVWSSEKLLPGYPRLQARLDATAAGMAPFAGDMTPQQHYLRTLGRLRTAGLVNCSVRTFAGDVHAPLIEPLRDALAALFRMRWPGVDAELAPAEREQYLRLCLPESPDFIVDAPDYCAFFTYTLFCGYVRG